MPGAFCGKLSRSKRLKPLRERDMYLIYRTRRSPSRSQVQVAFLTVCAWPDGLNMNMLPTQTDKFCFRELTNCNVDSCPFPIGSCIDRLGIKEEQKSITLPNIYINTYKKNASIRMEFITYLCFFFNEIECSPYESRKIIALLKRRESWSSERVEA